MTEVLALQDLELEGAGGASQARDECCMSYWASLSDLTVEDLVL